MVVSDRVKAAKRAAVPIVSIETADPAETIRSVAKAINAKDQTAFMQWDVSQSLRGMNEKGDAAVAEMASGEDPKFFFRDPGNMLACLMQAPERTVCFMHNAHRFIDTPEVAQGMWNLRDNFKTKQSMLILLSPGMKLPDELTQDVVCLSEELPNVEGIKKIVSEVITVAETHIPGLLVHNDVIVKACDTLTGLSAFACEQQLAMSITKEGVDMDELWMRKQKQVEQTDGLSVERPSVTLKDMMGCERIVQFGKALFGGGDPPTSLWLLDEIEKSMAGAKGDMSGTSQDQLMVLLTVMQDFGITGWIEVGPPGAAKTYFPQCLAGEFGVPFGRIDLGAMKDSLVGGSERKIRAAMKVARAISDNRGMFVATCNSITSLPPELRRRFTLGTWMFMLPTKEERKPMWKYYAKRMGLKDKQADSFNDEGWTGAEIKACCDVARRTGLSISEAAGYIVPVSKAASETIDTLYRLAHNRFLCASHEGLFRNPKQQTASTGRSMELQ